MLPTATQVAQRSLVLAAIVCRAFIDSGETDPDAISLHEHILSWLTRLNLWDEMEPSEEKLLRAPLGRLASADVLRATWLVEGLAVLAWAIGRFDLPLCDEQVNPYAITDALWFLSGDAADIIGDAVLRSPAELEAYRELLYAIHSRLRDFTRHQIKDDFIHWINPEWLAYLNMTATDLVARGDLSIDGKPIWETEKGRLREVLSITSERHRATIWLMGEQTNYSEITVDT